MFKPTPKTNMATEKTYIGNGRQKEGSAYITITLDLNALANCPFSSHEDKVTVRAILARKAKPNGHGTHTLYVPATVDQELAAQNALMDQQEIESLRS